MASKWTPLTLYRHGEIVEHEGEHFRVRCTEHGDDCPGGDLRSGFLAPPLCIEDGFDAYVKVEVPSA